MVTQANITPNVASDGLPYAIAATMPTVEADLYNSARIPNAPPVPVLYDRALMAVVTFTAGPGAVGPSYVVLQVSVDGGKTWIDVSWCVWNGTSGTATFVLSAGSDGANSFQQTRSANTAPAASGFNTCALGGLFRFVGRTGPGSSASPSPGPSPSPGVAPMAVTIWYKGLGLR